MVRFPQTLHGSTQRRLWQCVQRKRPNRLSRFATSGEFMIQFAAVLHFALF